jgi:hypothetical protein
MIESITEKVADISKSDGGKFAESLKEDNSAGRDFAKSLKEDTGAGKDFAESVAKNSEDKEQKIDWQISETEDDGGKIMDWPEKPSYYEDGVKEGGEQNKADADSRTETVKNNNGPEKDEKINPEDYLTKEQIDTLKQKYKELGYSDEEIEANVQEYAQKARARKEAEEKGLDNLDNKQKGNYGEMKTDLDMLDKGYVRISKEGITSLDDKGHQGIDGVYENPDGKPQYLIADSKYGSSQLSETKDGKQMSDEWIDKRLDEAVGKEKADEIRMEQIENPDNVDKSVAHIDSDGNVVYTDVGNSEEGDNKDE